jgi:hypothetical protein
MDNQMGEQDFSKKLGQIAARAWSDDAFKKRLMAEPAAVAAEYGMPLPPGLQLRVVEDTPTVRHFILPPGPRVAELSDEELDQVAGGQAATLYTGDRPRTDTSTTTTSSSCSSCW